MDASIERLCGVFNFLEALLWLGIAAGFAAVFYRRRKNPRLMLAAGLLFVAFGVSDFVEIKTGAWYRPWWLFAWKAASVVGFFVVFVLFWRRRSAAASPASAALRLPVPRWVAFLWRAGCVALLVAVGILLCIPVARIDQETCSRIQPGMTLAEAEQIIGAPPGWYDGVREIRTDAPGRKGGNPYWVGSRGEIVLDLDANDRVVKATFCPATVLDRPPLDFVVDRLVSRWFR